MRTIFHKCCGLHARKQNRLLCNDNTLITGLPSKPCLPVLTPKWTSRQVPNCCSNPLERGDLKKILTMVSNANLPMVTCYHWQNCMCYPFWSLLASLHTLIRLNCSQAPARVYTDQSPCRYIQEDPRDVVTPSWCSDHLDTQRHLCGGGEKGRGRGRACKATNLDF